MLICSCMPAGSIWDPGLDALARDPAMALHAIRKGLSPANLPEETELLIVTVLPEERLDALPRLKAIFNPGAGMNHVPLARLGARGVRVYNAHANAAYVAEHALAMTLALMGRIVEFHNDLAHGRWHGYWVKGGDSDQWESLRGKTCAILGTGSIGVELARLLAPFSCRVVGWRRDPSRGAPPGFDALAATADDAIAAADIVFSALPGTPETDGLLSSARLMAMRGKILVNVGRASVADEEGLYRALSEGVLAGAALDPWYVYPKVGKFGEPSRFPIHRLPNVILSPHVAGSARQSMAEAVSATIDNVRRFALTGEAENEVDPASGY